MRPAKRRPDRPRRAGALAPLGDGQLLGRCWFSRQGEYGPQVQVLSVRMADGHMDCFVSWFRDGKPVVRHRCGKEKPLDETELDKLVAEVQEAVGEDVPLVMTDFRPYKTRAEQERELRRLGIMLAGMRRPRA